MPCCVCWGGGPSLGSYIGMQACRQAPVHIPLFRAVCGASAVIPKERHIVLRSLSNLPVPPPLRLRRSTAARATTCSCYQLLRKLLLYTVQINPCALQRRQLIGGARCTALRCCARLPGWPTCHRLCGLFVQFARALGLKAPLRLMPSSLFA